VTTRPVPATKGAGDAGVGALATWQERVRNDPRSRLTCDALSAAACMEANGDDAAREGFPAIAAAWYRDASARLRGHPPGGAAKATGALDSPGVPLATVAAAELVAEQLVDPF
jgi:hypothetical protein